MCVVKSVRITRTQSMSHSYETLPHPLTFLLSPPPANSQTKQKKTSSLFSPPSDLQTGQRSPPMPQCTLQGRYDRPHRMEPAFAQPAHGREREEKKRGGEEEVSEGSLLGLSWPLITQRSKTAFWFEFSFIANPMPTGKVFCSSSFLQNPFIAVQSPQHFVKPGGAFLPAPSCLNIAGARDD